MINLLPPEMKSGYQYAQRNVSLLHWVVSCLACLVGLGIIGTYGWLSMHRSLTDATQQTSSIQASLKKAKLSETNAQITDISNSFKLVEKVLGQEILFSKLLTQMATALPNGAKLTGLNIAQVSGGSGLDVTAEASSYNVATQVAVNLAAPANQIFAKADIQNIGCDATAAVDKNYPCTIVLRAQFAQNNPFLFINQKQVKS